MALRTAAWAVAAGMALAACAPREAQDPAREAPTAAIAPAAGVAITNPRDLFGQWRLVELTGQPLPPEPVVHLLIGGDHIEAVSQCITFGFGWDITEGALRVGERLPAPAARPPRAAPLPPPAPVCARTRSPVEQAFPQVMRAARRVERRGERVAFVGALGEAVVERPAGAVVNPMHNAPGPGPWLMWGAWKVAAINGAPPSDEGIEMLFTQGEIEARSGCVSLLWRFEQDGERLTIGPESWPHAVCERTRSPAETALEGAMAGTVRIARSTPTERLLTGAHGSVLLRR